MLSMMRPCQNQHFQSRIIFRLTVTKEIDNLIYWTHSLKKLLDFPLELDEGSASQGQERLR